MDALLRLAAALAAKSHLNEDEFKLYSVILPYLECNYRLALLTIHEQAKKEGFNEEDLSGYTEANA